MFVQVWNECVAQKPRGSLTYESLALSKLDRGHSQLLTLSSQVCYQRGLLGNLRMYVIISLNYKY